METFIIPPDDCLVVKAISHTRSLRDAAVILGCDPATLVRKVQRISNEHGLLEKVNGHWIPTKKGRSMMSWAEESVFSQKTRLDERAELSIAATVWMTESALIPNFNQLDSKLRAKRFWFFRMPKHDFEEELLSGFSDYAIVCHAPNDPAIVHKKIAPEKWVVITPPAWKDTLAQHSELQLRTFLSKKPFIRHTGINPAEMLGLKLENNSSDFLLDALISIRSAVESGYGWSCVPAILVRQAIARNTVFVPNFKIHSGASVCIWWRRS